MKDGMDFFNKVEKPKVYIKKCWENRKGYKYEQPVEYCNGVRLSFEVIRDFEKIFKTTFSVAQKESNAYNEALKDSQYFSKLWKNDEAKNMAFEKIYEFNLNGKSGTGSSTTPLFPFEIYMMNDGFEMVSFCEMNAINSAFSIVAEKQKEDVLINPKSVKYSRCYRKDDYFVCLAFGFEIKGRKTNFYFVTNKSVYTYQVDNDIKNYSDAINGKLKPLEFTE